MNIKETFLEMSKALAVVAAGMMTSTKSKSTSMTMTMATDSGIRTGVRVTGATRC